MSRLLLLTFFFTPYALSLGILQLRSGLTVNLPHAGETFLPNYLPGITQTISNLTAVGINKTKTDISDLKNITRTGVQMVTNFTKNADEEFLDMYNKFSNITANITDEASSAVDCLGLGQTVAKTLEYVFQAQAEGPNALDVKFFLTSSKQPKRVIITSGSQFGLEWTDFDITRLTVIIVHGFLSSGNESWIRDMEDAFQKWGDVNILAVDWSAGGNTLNYLKAATNTKIAGIQISKILEEIANYTLKKSPVPEENWGKLYCIGHSLGAHICGVAADEIKQSQPSWRIHRITGLDPAQPCFKTTDNALKLDKNDAPFIDIIHTNARLWWQLGLGLPNAMGHMDFYPNGGRLQPGCALTYSSILDIIKIPTSVVNKAICSHGRSYLYFTESILSTVARNCTFSSDPWDHSLEQALRIISEAKCTLKMNYDCAEMGINSVNYPQSGSFFTVTSLKPPYCNPDESDANEVKKVVQEELGGVKGMLQGNQT